MKISTLLRFSVTAVLALCTAHPAHGGSESEFETTASDEPQSSDLGTGKFTKLPFHVSVSVRGGYDDNITTRRENREKSGFTSGTAEISYDAGNDRTKLTVNAGGGLTYYFDRISERDYDINSHLGVHLTHRATPRLSFDLNGYAAYLSQPDFSFEAGINRRSGNYFYSIDKLAATYLWTPRFSTATSYTLEVINYENAEISSYQDRWEHTFGNEFRFLLTPTTTVLFDYRYEIVDYESNLRDSTSHFFLAGVDHSFSSRFNASFRGGVQYRSYNLDPTVFTGEDETRTDPYFEATVNYALGRRLSLSWNNRYSIEEPGVPGSPSRTTYRTGLQAKYDITPRITTTLGAYYQHDDNEGFTSGGFDSPAFTEDSFDIALAARYAITRWFAVEVGYNHTEVMSDIALREYSRNRYFAGIALTF